MVFVHGFCNQNAVEGYSQWFLIAHGLKEGLKGLVTNLHLHNFYKNLKILNNTTHFAKKSK